MNEETVPVDEPKSQVKMPRKRQWIWYAAAIAALVILAVLFILALTFREKAPAEPSVPAVSLPENQCVVAVAAENLAVEPGDVLSICLPSGVIDSLQYVQVYSAQKDSVSVLLSQKQLEDYLRLGVSRATVALRAKAGTPEAEQMLAWQAQYNAPTVQLSLSEADKTIPRGSKTTLRAEVSVTPAEADPGEIVWRSSDETVALVDSGGTVTAIAAGTATITAECGEAAAECSITVYVAVTELNLSQSEAELALGNTLQLSAQKTPEDADGAIQWSSAVPSVATVDEDGLVTAVGAGEAEITAKCADAETVCIVTVIVPAEEVRLSNATLSMSVGKTTQLQAVVLPEQTTDKLTWKSANPAIATVSADGTIAAVSAGTVKITAACGGVSAVCTVTVNP